MPAANPTASSGSENESSNHFTWPYWIAFIIDLAVLNSLVYYGKLAGVFTINAHVATSSSALVIVYNTTIVTMSLVILPSVAIFWILGQWMDAIKDRDDRPRTKSMLVAGRLGAVLAPVLWMLLAAFSPWSGPVLLAALALPFVFMGLQVAIGYPAFRWTGLRLRRAAQWLLGPQVPVAAATATATATASATAGPQPDIAPPGQSDDPSAGADAVTRGGQEGGDDGDAAPAIERVLQSEALYNLALANQAELNAYITAADGRDAVQDDLDAALRSAVGRVNSAQYDENLDDAIDRLLRAGANPVAYDDHSNSAFHIAVLSGDVHVVKMMIQVGGFDPDHLDHQGRTPIQAALHGRRDGVVELLRAYQVAAAAHEEGHEALPQCLRDMGLDDHDGPAVLNRALKICLSKKDEPNHEALIRLLRLGADPKTKRDIDEYTVLHVAVMADDGADFLRQLLDLTCPEGVGNVGLFQLHNRLDVAAHLILTPLILAVKEKKLAHIHHLVMAGADLVVWISKGFKERALMLLVKAKGVKAKNYVDSAQKLLSAAKNPADVNAVDEDGNTALHHAAEANNEDFVAMLLHHGADPNKTNTAGKVPAALASVNSKAFSLLNQAMTLGTFKDKPLTSDPNADGETTLSMGGGAPAPEQASVLVQHSVINADGPADDNAGVQLDAATTDASFA